jgi:hypothetical protein
MGISRNRREEVREGGKGDGRGENARGGAEKQMKVLNGSNHEGSKEREGRGGPERKWKARGDAR